MSERLDTIQRYVSDMLAVVRHVQEAVDRQKTDSRVVRIEQAHALLQKISLATNTHAGELRRLLSERGALSGSNEDLVDSTINTLKEAVTSTLGQAAGIIGMVRPNRVSLMLRDDYTAMNLAAMAYTMLHTTAVVLHDEAVASLAVNHLHDITPLIIEINEVTPRVVAIELLDEAGQVDLAAVDQAIANTQAAWNQDHVHRGHRHSWEDNGHSGEPPGEPHASAAFAGERGEPYGGPVQPDTPPIEPQEIPPSPGDPGDTSESDILPYEPRRAASSRDEQHETDDPPDDRGVGD